MIRNLKIFWKLMILAIIIPLAVAITAGIALNEAGKLKYEFDNMYGFMLIPIVDLDEANLARESLDGNIHELTRSDLSADRRAKLTKAIQSDDARLAVLINKYKTEWVTTLSPEFSAALAAMGQQGLQTEEADALTQVQTAYTAYASKRDELLSGSVIDSESIYADLNQMESAFVKLVKVNLKFADLSNQSAQATIVNMRWLLLIVPGLLGLIALGVAFYISRAIIDPIAQLRALAEKVSLGDLSATVNINSRDEIGDLATAFGRMVTAVRFFMAEEQPTGD